MLTRAPAGGICFLAILGVCGLGLAEKKPDEPPPSRRVGPLTQEQAAGFARLALKGVRKEYPNKPGHVITGEKDVLGPKQMHPAFYGCYDWHSSVHGHWMLVRLLKQFPTLS